MHTTIIDRLYGSHEVSPSIIKILSTPIMQRLKKIRQNGVAFMMHSGQSTTRYEHSVGAMLLTKLLGGSEIEQIRALLHDVSYTTFSHLVDHVLSHQDQDFHKKIRKQFLASAISETSLQECGLSINDFDFDLMVPSFQGSVNTDRVDYCLRDLNAMSLISQSEYATIINYLVYNNQGEILCKNLESARFLFDKFLEANEKIYFDPKVEAASLVMSCILQNMLKKGLLTLDDFLLTDDIIETKILQSEYKNLMLSINTGLTLYPSNEGEGRQICRKLRYLNPLIEGLEGRLTDHCKISQEKLKRYLMTPTKVYYAIPLLDSASL